MFRKLLNHFISPAKTGMTRSSSARPRAFASTLLTAALVAIFGTALCSSAFAQSPVVFTGFQRVLPITLAGPEGVAVDASGNIYIADNTAGLIYKEVPLAAGGYTQSTIGTVAGAVNLALDSNGDVFVTTGSGGSVVELVNSSGTYTPAANPVVVELGYAWGVAVDSNGNVFVSDNNSSAVYEESPSGGSYVQTSIGSGWGSPAGIAVDSANNVYVADQDGSVVELSASNLNNETTISNNLYEPTGVAVDAHGNIYVTDNGQQTEFEFSAINGGSSSYAQIAIAYPLDNPYASAVDSLGNVYVADDSLPGIYEIGNNFGSINVLNANVGNNQVTANFTIYGGSGGTLKPHQTLKSHSALKPRPQVQYSPETISSVAVVTQGAASLDFSAGTATCTATTYTSVATCTVNVNFAPTAPGLRFGSVVLTDSNGNVAEGNVVGNGVAPQAAFLPGTPSYEYYNCNNCGLAPHGKYSQKSRVKSLKGNGKRPALSNGGNYPGDEPFGVAVDAAGNVYVSDQDYCAIYESPAASNGANWNTLVTADQIEACPQAIAVDGGGNVFFTTDGGSDGVWEAQLSGGSYNLFPIDLDGNGSIPAYLTSIAVDVNDNLYISSPDSIEGGLVLELVNANGYYSYNFITGNQQNSSIQQPMGIAVDANANVYFTDYAAGVVYESTPTTGGNYNTNPVIRGFDSPTSVSVDASGNLYVVDLGADNGTSIVYIAYPNQDPYGYNNFFEPNSNGYYVFPITSSTMFYGDYIWWAAVGSNGNIYMTDDGWYEEVNELDVADAPSLQFASTTMGTTSPDSPQTPFLFNNGNAPLYLAIPTTGTNASISANFLLNSSESSLYPGLVYPVGDCPLVTPGYDGAPSISADSGCALPVSFEPESIGTINGTLVVMDNSLNQVPTNNTLKHAELKARPEGPAPSTYATQTINLNGTGLDVFSISATGSVYALIAPGGSATYTFTVTPIAPATTFPTEITLTAVGGPIGSTYIFSEPTIAAGSGSQTITLTVTVPVGLVVQNVAPQQPGSKFPTAPLALALLILPLAAKMRKTGKRLSRMVAVLLLLVAGITATVGLSGCYSKLVPASYVITVQGQSGAVIHTTEVAISVK